MIEQQKIEKIIKENLKNDEEVKRKIIEKYTKLKKSIDKYEDIDLHLKKY